MKPLLLSGRLIFGAWMLANALNHFFFSFWAMPPGHEPLAAQLMAALTHSKLLDVAMVIEGVTGALILCGYLVPVALCVVMPVTTCALFWALILDHHVGVALLGLVAYALNGLLMLAYLDYYADLLRRSALMLGEASSGPMSFDLLFVNPAGRTTRAEFVPALITLLVVVAFYVLVVTGRTAEWCLLALLFPAVVLHARRLHDMGRSAWLLLAPGVLLVVAFAHWVHILSLGATLNTTVAAAALALSAGFALWGCVAPGQAAENRFGAVPVAAQG